MRYNSSPTLRPSSLLQPGLSPCRAKQGCNHQHSLTYNILHCPAAVRNTTVILFTNTKIYMPVCFTRKFFPGKPFPDLRDTSVKFKQCWGSRVQSLIPGWAWCWSIRGILRNCPLLISKVGNSFSTYGIHCSKTTMAITGFFSDTCLK